MDSGATRRVSYCYDPAIAEFSYTADHMMVPYRLALTHSLVEGYGLTKKMEVVRPPKATYEEMAEFHSRAYLDFLRANNSKPPAVVDERKGGRGRGRARGKKPQPEVVTADEKGDCPLFEGVYDFSSISTGGSLTAASKLCAGRHDVAVNWGGGLHHALRDNASGFCYVNDAVLAIGRLLTTFRRVLYIDIDLHHGDGVEVAFRDTDRVVTLSLHRFGEGFFPETGDVTEVGEGAGKYYSLNIPLLDGMRDEAYLTVFKSISSRLVQRYRPEVIVMQCGADGLAGDFMDAMSLTTRGHGACVTHVLKLNLPVMLLGGGGYNPPNVARCWAYETALALGGSNEEPHNELPVISLLAHEDNRAFRFEPFTLHTRPQDREDFNTQKYLNGVLLQAYKNLEQLPQAPGISIADQMMMDTSSSSEEDSDDDDDDVRISQRLRDRLVEAGNEF